MTAELGITAERLNKWRAELEFQEQQGYTQKMCYTDAIEIAQEPDIKYYSRLQEEENMYS